MMIMKRYIVLSLALVATMTSCRTQFDALLASSDVDAKYKAAFEYFNADKAGKYQKAASLFESMAVLTSGTERDDTVQYYWGLSNYRAHDYFTAETNFSKFAENFPGSEFTPEARFLRVDCLYRQTYTYERDPQPTYAAISALNEFTKDYPESEHSNECLAMYKELDGRLDKKAYEAAKLYYRMEDFKASRVAFKDILRDDSENIYREDILYYIAMSSYKFAKLSVAAKQKERYMTFMDDYLNFVGEISESPYRRELDAMYAHAQKAIGKYAGTDEEPENEMTEKDYEKERKAAAAAQKPAKSAAQSVDKPAKVSKKAAKKAGSEVEDNAEKTE